MKLRAACCLIVLFLPQLARAEDWELTRPAAPRANNTRPAQPRARDTEPEGEGEGEGEQSVLRERYLRVLLGDPSQAFALERLLQLYRERDGNLDRLAAELEQLAAKGESYALTDLRAQVDAARGARDAARAAFVKAQALAPANATAPWLSQAQLEREAGDLTRAQTLLEQALARTKVNTERALVTRQLGELALDRQDYDEAEKRFGTLASTAHGGVFQATEFARALAARGLHERAVAAYTKTLEALRGDDRVLPPVLLALSRSQLETGDAEAALASLARARKLAASGSGERREIDEALVETYRRLGRLSELAEHMAQTGGGGADESELLGRIYDELGDQPHALEAFRRALARNPRALELRERVIHLLAQQGDLDAAVAEYRALVRLAPREPRFVIELAKLLMESGRRDEALRLLDQTGARFPSEARIHRSLLDVYSRWNEPARAAQTLLRLSRIEPEDPAHFIALGEQLLEQGDQDGALAVWHKILALGGDKARAHAALASTYLDHDMAARALPEYEAALKLEPDTIEYVRGLAETLEKLQRATDAAEHWQRVLVLAKDRAQKREARRRVVRLWSLSGELPQRIAVLERTFAAAGAGKTADVDGVEAGRFLAEAYRALASGRRRGQGDPQKLDAAERVLARVLELDPGDIESMLSLERLRTLRGNLAGAIDVLKRLLEADPKNAQAYLTRLSADALALYRDDDAIAFAERLVAQNPKDAQAHERLGDLYRARQNVDRAVASYEQAIALDENAFGVGLELAELYLARGDTRSGHAVLSRVVRACPDDEMVKRAARELIQLDLSAGQLGELEHVLLPLSIGNPQRTIHRAMLVELYDAMTRPLIEAARDATPEGERSRAELRAIGRRAIKPLLEALADADDAQRRIAIDVLGQINNEHAAAALLGAAERDGDVALRRRALLAAGAVAPDALARRVGALARVQERRLRDAAAWALARMRGPIAVSELRALSTSSTPAVRGQALLGLGRAHDAGSSAVCQQALRGDPSGFVRGAAALALGMGGEHLALASLVTALRTEQGESARAAAIALGLLGDRSAAEPLAEAAFASDAALRGAALWSLRRLAAARDVPRLQPPEQSEPEDRLALEPELGAWLALEPGVGVDAALGAFARELRESAGAALQGAPATARSVLMLLSREDPALAPSEPYPAFLALRNALAPVLAQLAQHPDPSVRAAALALVAGSDAGGAERSVIAALDDGDAQVQSAALDALGGAVAASPDAFERLAAIARDDARWGMRLRAVNALGRGGGERAFECLRRVLLGDAYAYVREAAAVGLGQARAGSAVAALAEALARDPEPRVRGAAAAALRAIGGPEAMRALERAAAPAPAHETGAGPAN